MSKMLIAAAPSVAAFREYEDRPIHSDEVKCKVLYAAPKHGTELTEFTGKSVHATERYDSEWQLFVPRKEGEKPDTVFGEWNVGNQWVGEVIEAGSDVKDFKLGDLICSYGGIRETHIIKAVDNFRCRKLPDISLWKTASAMIPPSLRSAAGPRRPCASRRRGRDLRPGRHRPDCSANLRKAWRLSGCCYRPDFHRREIAMKNGATYALDSTNTDVGLELKKLTGKRGVDVIIETSGHVSALQSALRGLAYGGTISFVAFAKPFASLELGREAHFNNAKIVFSRACSEPLPD